MDEEQRLYWRVLKMFHALPTEERVRKMLDRDFLWCGLQILLDEEEELGRLCPSCQGKAQENRCLSCGVLRDGISCGFNENFDLDLFYGRGEKE